MSRILCILLLMSAISVGQSQVPKNVIHKEMTIGAKPDSASPLLWQCYHQQEPNPIEWPGGYGLVTIVSTECAGTNRFFLASPEYILFCLDAKYCVGQSWDFGPYSPGELLDFRIHHEQTGKDRYPIIDGIDPWTMYFEDWPPYHMDCNDVVVEIIKCDTAVKADTIDIKGGDNIVGAEYPPYIGHFEPGGMSAIDRNDSMGDHIFKPDTEYVLEFTFGFHYDACPGKPGYDPTVIYDIDIEGVTSYDDEKVASGWSDTTVIEHKYSSTPTESDLERHDMQIKLTFKSPDGDRLGSQKIENTFKVFFDKCGGWYWQEYPRDTLRFNCWMENWFYFWRRIEEFEGPPYETQWARFDPGAYPRTRGWYDPALDDSVYWVSHYSQEDWGFYPLLVTNPCCDTATWIRGIDKFAHVCRHENLHRTLFLSWWHSYREYQILRDSLDIDGDYVPRDVEVPQGLDPNDPCSHPCAMVECCGGRLQSPQCPNPPIFNDFEWFVYKEQHSWTFRHWNHLDWACPGKQTVPNF